MDQIYELVLDHLSSYSHTAGYPELIVPALAQVTPLLSHPTSPQSFYSPSITLCNSSETPHHKKRLLTVLYSVYWWRFTNVTSVLYWGFPWEEELFARCFIYQHRRNYLYTIARDKHTSLSLGGVDFITFREQSHHTDHIQRIKVTSDLQWDDINKLWLVNSPIWLSSPTTVTRLALLYY